MLKNIFFIIALFLGTTALSKEVLIEKVREVLRETKNAPQGPSFDAEIPLLDDSTKFRLTPMGAYLDNLYSGLSNSEQIDKGTKNILDDIIKNKRCELSCSDELKSEIKNNKTGLLKRLKEVTRSIAKNEIRNHEKFNVFYHGFPNDFRLYQDVLRIIKSFEFLKNLTTTYPFRDFSFTDERVDLPKFLEGWWPAYLEYAKEEKKEPFPTKGEKAPGRGVGLTFYPDSIPYAQTYLLATNVNWLGNNLRLMNSSIFFFLNSSSATGIDIVDFLLEQSLSSYVKDPKKLKAIVADLKEVFNRGMNKTGGQLAQIFVDKQKTEKVSYISWNGGEPMWISNKTDSIAMANNTFRPINMFYPDTPELKLKYKLVNPSDYMDLFINNQPGLVALFTYLSPKKLLEAANHLGSDADSEKTKIFFVQDYSQARILPKPRYFTDEEITGVKIYTMNKIDSDEEKKYNHDLFNIIDKLMAEFLAQAQSSQDFKAGEYKLKQLFLDNN